MIHKNQFHSLTGEDIKFLPTLAKHLRTLKGEAHAQTNRQIQKKFPEIFSCVSRGKLTAMIHEIRTRRMVKNLIASPYGFYISLDSDRIKAYVETLEGHVEARKKSIKSFGKEPGKGVKKRFKVVGYTDKNGRKVRGYYKTYPGFKLADQIKMDFEKEVKESVAKGKKKVNKNQLKMF
jgi:hypothetical protein